MPLSYGPPPILSIKAFVSVSVSVCRCHSDPYSHGLVDTIFQDGVRVLLLQESQVKLTLVDGTLVWVSFDVLWLSILLPVVHFEALLHLIVLVFVPEQHVCHLDPANDAHCQTNVRR